jgi:hypothetical protein
MTEGNDSNYEVLCTSFYTIINNDTPSETVVTESYTVRCEPVREARKAVSKDSPEAELMA